MGFVGNYLENLCKIALGRTPSKPLLFSYYLTHRCDLNCKYCCDGGGRRFKEDRIEELPTDEAKTLLSILAKASDTIDITGGEPMLRDDLEELLLHIRNSGARAVLNTKGIGLELRPDIIKHSDVLVIGVDSLNPEHLAEVVGSSPDSAKAIIDALHFAIGRCRDAGTRLVVSSVATPDGLDDIDAVIDFALENKLGFHISPEIVGTEVNPKLRGNARYIELVDRLIKLKDSARGILGVKAYLEGIRDFPQFPCHPLLMPVLRPDGRMYYPCLESRQAETSLLAAGSYPAALSEAVRKHGPLPACRDCCHIFCHMALSLLQTHPLAALGESKHWKAQTP